MLYLIIIDNSCVLIQFVDKSIKFVFAFFIVWMFIEIPLPSVFIQNSICINSSVTVHNFPRDCDGLNVVTN